MSRMARSNRRMQRDEIARTWFVYDALRSITKADFAASARAADGTDATSPPDGPLVESASPTGVGGCVQCATAERVRELVRHGAR